jgi:hypothetical protein
MGETRKQGDFMNNSINCEAFFVREAKNNLVLFKHEYEWPG